MTRLVARVDNAHLERAQPLGLRVVVAHCHVSTPMTLPYVVDAQTSLAPEELAVLKEQYDTEASSGHITTQTKFNYAWALVKSPSRQQMLHGVALLTGARRLT